MPPAGTKEGGGDTTNGCLAVVDDEGAPLAVEVRRAALIKWA